MERYQQADRHAADLLIERASPVLYRHLLRHSQVPADADDLLQNTWLRVHQARHSYRPGRALLPWLFAIADHTRIDAFRHRRSIREVAMETLPEPPFEPASPDPRAHRLAHALHQLPAGQRHIVELLKYSGLSLEETAQATHSTVGAIKVKAHRAYQTLRALLSAEKDSRS